MLLWWRVLRMWRTNRQFVWPKSASSVQGYSLRSGGNGVCPRSWQMSSHRANYSHNFSCSFKTVTFFLFRRVILDLQSLRRYFFRRMEISKERPGPQLATVRAVGYDLDCWWNICWQRFGKYDIGISNTGTQQQVGLIVKYVLIEQRFLDSTPTSVFTAWRMLARYSCRNTVSLLSVRHRHTHAF